MTHLSIDTDNPEFQNALKLIQYTRQSVFLTGKAYTGKSTFLKYVCQNTRKKYVVLAPTGIAAINAGGSTLHSFFKLPFHPLLPDDPKFAGNKLKDYLKYSSDHRKLIKNIELVIIDEISMVRADIIDFIDRILRTYSQNMREPFGGKQLLLVGDVYQLEPVVKSDEREILNRFYPNPYFFSANVFRQIELVSIELTKVYRQTDKVFVSVLDHIRTNTAGNADLQLLNTRCNVPENREENDLYITLATRRDTVDYINEKKLAELPGEPVTLKGVIKGEFPENSLPTLMELIVKPGAQIIFIKNDQEKRWVNGTIGTISGISDDGILYIVTEEGREFDVRQESWSNIRYHYNEQEKKIEEEELEHLHAISHPAGMGHHRPQKPGTYVQPRGHRLYRRGVCRRTDVCGAEPVYVARRHPPETGNHPERHLRAAGNRKLRQAFQRPDRIRPRHEAGAGRRGICGSGKAFNKGDFTAFLSSFFKAIHSRYDIEKPLIQRFIRRKLNIINRLKEENRRLKEEMAAQRKNLEKYAREYYLMGNECITKAHDARAAIANYNKAIELYPGYVDAWVRKGITLFDEGHTEEAGICLNKAVEIRPGEFKAVYNRGKLRLHTGYIEGMP